MAHQFPFSDGAFGPFSAPTGLANAGITAYRKVYFVSPAGSDGNTGLGAEHENSFKTVQKALDTVDDEDTIIVMMGNYDEELTTGQNIGHIDTITPGSAGPGRGRYVSLIGATPTRIPYMSAQLWNQSGSTATLKLRSPGWRVAGFRLVGDTGSPICLDIEMDSGANVADTDWAPGCTIDHCSFLGALGSTAGINLLGVVHTRIEDNFFEGFTSGTLGAIQNVGSQFTLVGRAMILRNQFLETIVNIKVDLASSIIAYNIILDSQLNTITTGINLLEGTTNTVFGNRLGGQYQSGGVYTKETTAPSWIGNYCSAGNNVTGGISTGDPGG